MELSIIYSILAVSLLSSILIIVSFSKFGYSEKIMSLYIVFLTVFEFIGHFSIKLFPEIESNMPGLHLYTLIDFIVLFIFFQTVFADFDIKINRKIFLPIGVLLIVFNSIFIQDIYSYNGNVRITLDILIITCSLVFLIFYLVKISYEDKNRHNLHLLFVIVLFVKSSLSLLFYINIPLILTLSDSYRNNLFALRGIINLICAFLFLILSTILLLKYRSSNLIEV